MLTSIDEISAFLKKNGQRLRSLDDHLIDALEKTSKLVFPKAYRRFLSLMGRGAGDFMLGSDVFYPEIKELNGWGLGLIQENSLEPVPANAFFFWMHQGYQAAYFLSDGSDDPQVYFYSEGTGKSGFELKEKTLTDFFLNQLRFSFGNS